MPTICHELNILRYFLSLETLYYKLYYLEYNHCHHLGYNKKQFKYYKTQYFHHQVSLELSSYAEDFSKFTSLMRKNESCPLPPALPNSTTASATTAITSNTTTNPSTNVNNGQASYGDAVLEFNGNNAATASAGGGPTQQSPNFHASQPQYQQHQQNHRQLLQNSNNENLGLFFCLYY